MPRRAFQVQADERDHEITIQVRWDSTDLDRMQSALTNAYAMAFAELSKRIEKASA